MSSVLPLYVSPAAPQRSQLLQRSSAAQQGGDRWPTVAWIART